jgi:hypothetical protein
MDIVEMDFERILKRHHFLFTSPHHSMRNSTTGIAIIKKIWWKSSGQSRCPGNLT